jgi:hypothetical protein
VQRFPDLDAAATCRGHLGERWDERRGRDRLAGHLTPAPDGGLTYTDPGSTVGEIHWQPRSAGAGDRGRADSRVPRFGPDFAARLNANVAVQVGTVRELVARVADGSAVPARATANRSAEQEPSKRPRMAILPRRGGLGDDDAVTGG